MYDKCGRVISLEWLVCEIDGRDISIIWPGQFLASMLIHDLVMMGWVVINRHLDSVQCAQDNVSQEIYGRDIFIVQPGWFIYVWDNFILDHLMYIHFLVFVSHSDFHCIQNRIKVR